MIRRLIPFILMLLSVGPVAHADLDYRGDLFLFGDYRKLNQELISEYDSAIDFAGVLGVDLTWTFLKMRIEVRPELRTLYTNALVTERLDPAFITVESTPRFMKLGGFIQEGEDNQTYFDLEKLSFTLQTDNLEFSIGRRPLGLGVLKYLPVWNKFTIVLPIQTGPPLIYNPDNAILRYQVGSWAGNALAIEGDTGADAVRLGQLNFYGDWVEAQTLFGRWWNHSVAGFALSKDLSGVSLRAETLWVGLSGEDEEQLFQGGWGIEYAFSDKFSATVEGLYLTNGVTDADDYALTPASRFSPFRARQYSLILLEYKFLPTWRFVTGPFWNLVDRSVFYMNDIKWSVSDESELTLQAKTPLGPDRTEFSPETFQFVDGGFIGYPYVFNIFYKVFF